MKNRFDFGVFLAIAVCVITGGVLNSVAQNSTREYIETALKLEFSAESFPLLTHENAALKEEFIGLQDDENWPLVKLIDFYEVTPGTYTIEDNRVVSSITRPARAYWLVAVDREKNIYWLEGFADPVANFNRLIKKLGIRLKDASDAESLSISYLKVCNKDIIYSSMVVDELSLQRAAITDFRSRYSSKLSSARFNKWWRAVPSRIKRGLSGIKALRNGERFSVQYFRYDKERVFKDTIFIDHDGLVEIGDTSKVY